MDSERRKLLEPRVFLFGAVCGYSVLKDESEFVSGSIANAASEWGGNVHQGVQGFGRRGAFLILGRDETKRRPISVQGERHGWLGGVFLVYDMERG